ncbi:DUF6146 family protein [Gaetbulibacter sp. PBL-D1]|uniref:DUF6146 family protein n=1 Tax=Gaetbulibacter sp. PBL-D1 TaxID=3422594 RepID=UPI003D2F0FFE
MKAFVYTILLALFVFSCNSTKTVTEHSAPKTISEEDTVRITNDELEYEIIIIEPGFNTWLQSVARPEGYYSQDFLENRNLQYVIAWNQRVMQPQQFNPDLYAMQIDYQNGIDYGYEVNYKLYNYFIYFQLTYKQKLAGFIPRI